MRLVLLLFTNILDLNIIAVVKGSYPTTVIYFPTVKITLFNNVWFPVDKCM